MPLAYQPTRTQCIRLPFLTFLKLLNLLPTFDAVAQMSHSLHSFNSLIHSASQLAL